jgi:hypothetical protein
MIPNDSSQNLMFKISIILKHEKYTLGLQFTWYEKQYAVLITASLLPKLQLLCLFFYYYS